MPAGNQDAWWRVYHRSQDVVQWAKRNGHHRLPEMRALRRAILEEKTRQAAIDRMEDHILSRKAAVYLMKDRRYSVQPNPGSDIRVRFGIYWIKHVSDDWKKPWTKRQGFHRYTALSETFVTPVEAQAALDGHASTKRGWVFGGYAQLRTDELLLPEAVAVLEEEEKRCVIDFYTDDDFL